MIARKPARSALARTLAPLAVTLALAAAASGCQDEGYVTLFDEAGTWSLVRFNTEGSFAELESNNRRDNFLLFFERTSAAEARPAGRMAAATCVDQMGDSGLQSSTCDDGFLCRCFDYNYEDATMVMTEYAGEGQTLYTPEDGEPAPGEPVTIFLSEVPEAANTYGFKPLPFMLFESDGMGSEYQFQQKAASFFDKTGCATICFGAAPME
ncbi:MAG: hypothetical protein R3B09_14510 [Nannocystaceae bacterium]